MNLNGWKNGYFQRVRWLKGNPLTDEGTPMVEEELESTESAWFEEDRSIFFLPGTPNMLPSHQTHLLSYV